MRRSLTALLLAVAVLAAGAPNASAARCGKVTGASRPSGDPARANFRVRAVRVRCRQARRVVRRGWRSLKGDGYAKKRPLVKGYFCSTVNKFRRGRIAFRCNKGDKIVTARWRGRAPYSL
jgi:hypothetical protein